MANERLAFGRRQSIAPDRSKMGRQVPSRPPETTETVPGQVLPTSALNGTDSIFGQIEARGGRILLIGELLAFAGLIMVTLGTMMLPSNPADLSYLDGRIFIPDILHNIVLFDRPYVSAYRYVPGLRAVDAGVGNMLFTCIAILAIIRKRWILAALSAGYFIFPFSLFGVHLATKPVSTLFWLLVLAGLRVAPIQTSLKVIILVVGVAVLPFVASMLRVHLPDLDSRTATYGFVRFSDLSGNKGKSEEIRIGAGRTQIRGTSFAPIKATTSDQVAAKAFVMAQEKAHLGDAAAATGYLAEARVGGFPRNEIEQKVADDIGAFAVASGVEGPIAQADLSARLGVYAIITRAMVLLGLAFALVGPIADIVHTAILERLRRMRRAERNIRNNASALGVSNVPDVHVMDSKEDLVSIASVHAREAVDAIERRTIAYRMIAIASAWAALYCFGGYLKFWLPEADSNTAFDVIAVPGSAAGSLVGLGGAVQEISIAWQAVRATVSLPAVLSLAPVGALFVRRFRPFALAVLLIISVLVPSAEIAPLRHPLHSTESAALTPAIRDALQLSLPVEGLRIGFDGLSSHLGPQASSRTRPPASVDPVVASYLLAQAAYLEDHPADAAGYLGRITDAKKLLGLIHQQRLSIMRDWVRAHGHDLPPEAADPQLYGSLDRARQASGIFLCVALFAACLAALAGVFGLVGQRRRDRLEAMRAAQPVRMRKGANVQAV